MRTHLGTAIVSLAAGLLVWGITTWLNLIPMPWALIVGCVIALVVGAVGVLLLSRRDAARRATASGLRAGGNVRVSDVTVTSQGADVNGSDVASDIRARGDIDLSRIRDDRP